MKATLVIAFVFLTGIAGCLAPTDAKIAVFPPAKLVGSFQNQDLRFSTKAELHADGTFVFMANDEEALGQAELDGRPPLSEPLVVKGSWRVESSVVYLEATTRDSRFQKEYFTVFVGGKIALAPKDRDSFYEHDAYERLGYLFKQPNQALQHNDPSCHAPCVRTCRASWGRG